MAKKTVNGATKTYADMHKNLKSMTEDQLVAAMQQVLDDDEPRVDMLNRLVGRLNKIRAQKVTTSVLGLLGYRGKRDVYAVLGHNR